MLWLNAELVVRDGNKWWNAV